MTQAVLIPTLPPATNTVEIPPSMRPEEKAKLLKELGHISTEIAKVQTRDEERQRFLDQRFKGIDARLRKVENTADESGRHDLQTVQKALEKEQEKNAKIKWWVLSLIGTLITSAIVGIGVHFLGG